VLLTTQQVAEQIGISRRRIQRLIQIGLLPARRYGHALLVDESTLPVLAGRKPGRKVGWSRKAMITRDL